MQALRASEGTKGAQGVVPLLMLSYRYNELLPDAAQQGLVTVDSVNERLLDGPNQSRSPYAEKQFFSIALAQPRTEATVSVYVGSEFWLGNTPAPATLSLNFGDAAGWRQVAMGSTVQVQVSGTGQTILAQTAAGTAATTVETNGPAVANRGASTSPNLALGLLASRAWPGFTPNGQYANQRGNAKAIAWIKYADGNTTGKLRKPLIFVEGIDFATDRGGNRGGSGTLANYPVVATGAIALSNFTSSGVQLDCGFRNGSSGWNEMVDYNNETPSLEKMPALRGQLQAPEASGGGGYDVIYLDFSDGATLIQHNAMVLVELLDWVNQPANRAPGAEEAVVMGASMGGQVARFALAWMEQQGLCHNAKLYVSFDSPHRGANIPLGIQHMLDRLQNVWAGYGGAQDVVNKQLRREAAYQMLVAHFDDATAAPFRNQWQTWQASAGSYPSLLRKVAIANGSASAAQQLGMSPGMQLLHTSASGFTLAVAGRNVANALPGTSVDGHNNVIFRWKRTVGFFNRYHYVEVSPSLGNYDTAPGSLYPTALIAHKTADVMAADWPSNTFMPTSSTLDVFAAGSILSPNFNYNISQQINPNRPDRSKYAFDAYFAASTVNEPHVQVTNGQPSSYGQGNYLTDNSTWLRNELKESAHNLNPVLTATYNFGSPYRHLLASVQVNAGSQLYLNNGTLPVSGGTSATQGQPEPGNFEVYTANCGTVVQVNSGGLLAVGTTSTYTASLRMSANSLLDLRSGGRVNVNAGSVLTIPHGATLVVRNGSTLTVDGQVRVESGAFVCVETGANLVFSADAELYIDPAATLGTNPALNLPATAGCSGQLAVCGRLTGGNAGVTNTGGRNEALQFDGNDVVSVPNTNSWVNHSLAQEFAVEAFIRADNLSISGAQTIFSSRHSSTVNSNGLDGILFSLYGGQLLLQLNSTNYYSSANLLPNDNGCHHVAVTRDNVNRVRFYIDGRETAYSPTSAYSAHSEGGLNVGGDNDYGSYGEYFRGMMGEVRVWNFWRSAEQIRQNSTAKLAAPQDGLVVYYDMQDATGSQRLSDLSGVTSTGQNAVPGVLGATASAGSDDPTWVAQCALACTVQGNFFAAPAPLSWAPADSAAMPMRKHPKDKDKDKNKAIAALSVSPNPATGSAMLHFEHTQAGSVHVWVQDLAGAERAAVLKETLLEVGPQDLALPIRQLPPGLYLIVVQSKDGQEHIRLQVN